MRRPVASHTTEAGLGLSFTGQSGMGGGGGVCATGIGAGSCFFASLRARGLCGCAFGAARGWDGDCDGLETAHRRMAASSAPESITHCIAEWEAGRDGSVANARMGVSSRGYAGPAGPESNHPTALDYQWPLNAHRVFTAGFVVSVMGRQTSRNQACCPVSHSAKHAVLRLRKKLCGREESN